MGDTGRNLHNDTRNSRDNTRNSHDARMGGQNLGAQSEIPHLQQTRNRMTRFTGNPMGLVDYLTNKASRAKGKLGTFSRNKETGGPYEGNNLMDPQQVEQRLDTGGVGDRKDDTPMAERSSDSQFLDRLKKPDVKAGNKIEDISPSYDPASGWKGEPSGTLKILLHKILESDIISRYGNNKKKLYYAIYDLYRRSKNTSDMWKNQDIQVNAETESQQASLDQRFRDSIKLPKGVVIRRTPSDGKGTYIYFAHKKNYKKLTGKDYIMRMVLNVESESEEHYTDVTQKIVNALPSLDYVWDVKIAKISLANNIFDNMIIFFHNPPKKTNLQLLTDHVRAYKDDVRPTSRELHLVIIVLVIKSVMDKHVWRR